MWTKEVYREVELFPLIQDLKMGPVTGISGPRMPVRLLKRAFGNDCFEVYYQSASHKSETKPTGHRKESGNEEKSRRQKDDGKEEGAEYKNGQNEQERNEKSRAPQGGRQKTGEQGQTEKDENTQILGSYDAAWTSSSH